MEGSSGIAGHRCTFEDTSTESESQHLETAIAVGIAVTLLSYFTRMLVYNGLEIRASGPSQQIV